MGIIKDIFFNFFSNKHQIITEKDITDSKHFCLVPWIHTHIMPNSKVIPCCVSHYQDTYGDLKTNSLTEIWNNSRYRTMRKLMLSDRPVNSCKKCYVLEKSNIQTMRKRINKEFSHHASLLKQTQANGYIANPKMKYLDIRFSNICNFKCRGCSPALSTKWYEDHQKLWNFKSSEPKLINAIKDSPKLWSEIESYLPDVEVAYFAGGEPLLMDEHYQTLEKLIEIGNTDITLQYNTNLSILKFKKYDLMQIWKNFKSVDLNISLDDIGSRGEYFRSGLDWENLLKNFREVKTNFPNFYFQVNCTISLFNIHRVPEVHLTLIQNGFIDNEGFNFNTLLDPPAYRTQVLPQKFKDETTIKLRNYMNKIQKIKPSWDWSKFISDLENQIHFMNSTDLSRKLHEFKDLTSRLDKIRNESFEKTYPELEGLI